jgi:hypothetical protein
MAKKDKKEELRQKAHFAAMEATKPKGGFPVPPRKAMARANRASKKLPYPVPPYPGANPMQLFRWAQVEWWKLGRWQGMAGPVVALVGLLTWEKEKDRQEAWRRQVDKIEVKQMAREMYGVYGQPKRRRKLLGLIPLPGGK